MPSDRSLRQIDWTQRTEPANLPEWMDEPCSLTDLRTCLHDLGQVNRLTFGYRPTLSFLKAAHNKQRKPLRILDVGFGGGDTLHRVHIWAHKHSIPVELTGIDLNLQAAAIAKQRYGPDNTVWLTGDALAYKGEADIILSSLLAHHLETPHIVQFLRWMEATATVGWFVNDLERSPRSATLFYMLSRVMRWHRFVQHDGPVSFARSFSSKDWNRMLVEADIPPKAVEVAKSFPSRLRLSRLK